MIPVADYVRRSAHLRNAMGSHLATLLKSGVSVVLDFSANTRANRAWMRTIFEEARAIHQLHYFDVSGAVCKESSSGRNASGDHEFGATDEQFDLVMSHFVAPTSDEGFSVVIHRQ
jgi:predicted kinase